MLRMSTQILSRHKVSLVLVLLLCVLATNICAAQTDLNSFRVYGYVDSSATMTFDRWDDVLPLDFDDPELMINKGYVVGTWSFLAYLEHPVNIVFSHTPFVLVSSTQSDSIDYTLNILYPSGSEYTYAIEGCTAVSGSLNLSGKGLYYLFSNNSYTYSIRNLSLMVQMTRDQESAIANLIPGLYTSDIVVNITT